MTPLTPLLLLGAYLLGSIPFGFLAGKMAGVDLRQVGSGNIGATNALRVLGKKWGYSVFALDFVKGFLGVWIPLHWTGQEGVAVLCALVVMVGHVFPVWLKFKGGKGIATSGGVLLGLIPIAFLTSFIAWVFFFFTTRYVSVASLAAAIMLPVTTAVLYFNDRASLLLLVVTILMCALAVVRHRSNIQRLCQGTEPRFSRKPKSTPSTNEHEQI